MQTQATTVITAATNLSAVRANSNRRAVFWLYAFCIFTMVFCVNAPAPLFELFRQRMSLSPHSLAILYSAYAGVVIVALPCFGRLSDTFGRRWLVMAGLVFIAGGSLDMALADHFLFLVAGRLMQALGVAAMSAPAASGLAELTSRRAHASTASVTTLALSAGGVSAPLFSGLVAEVLPSFPQAGLVCCAVMACLVLMGVYLMRDPFLMARSVTAPLPTPRMDSGRSRLETSFWQACAAVIACFGAQTTFFTVSGPIFGGLLHSHVFLTAGCAMSALMVGSGIANVLAGRMASRSAIALGMALLAPGAVGFFFGVGIVPLAALAPAVLAIGLGHGFSYAGAMRLINETASRDKRASHTSKFYVAIYIGGGLPVLGMGLLESSIGRPAAACVFGGLMALASVALLGWLRASRPATRA